MRTAMQLAAFFCALRWWDKTTHFMWTYGASHIYAHRSQLLAFPPSQTSFQSLLAVSSKSSQVEHVWGLMCCFNYFVLICIILDVDMCLWIKFLFTLIYEKGHCIMGRSPNLHVLFFFTQTLTAIASSKLSLSKDILLTAIFAVLWPNQDVFAETKCVWAHAYKTHNMAVLSQKKINKYV